MVGEVPSGLRRAKDSSLLHYDPAVKSDCNRSSVLLSLVRTRTVTLLVAFQSEQLLSCLIPNTFVPPSVSIWQLAGGVRIAAVCWVAVAVP